jgi:hypothetical protein
MTTDELIEAIHSLTDADELRLLQSELKGRLEDIERVDARRMARGLTIGTKVRIRHDAQLRPKYILGQIATVVTAPAQKRIGVRFDDAEAAGRFGGGEVRVPLTTIEVVD